MIVAHLYDVLRGAAPEGLAESGCGDVMIDSKRQKFRFVGFVRHNRRSSLEQDQHVIDPGVRLKAGREHRNLGAKTNSTRGTGP